jgi:FMN phosphatase YigB (HAD superfamily)
MNGAGAAPAAPEAVLIDVGLTLVHPDGGVLREELARVLPGARVGERDSVEALVLAAEARHLRLPEGEGDQRVAATWAMLLGLPEEGARVAWARAVARTDLYVELDPGAHALLGGLRSRGVVVAAVSNSDGTLGEELDRFGLLAYFDAVVDSTAVGVEKPDRRIYTEACEVLGLPPRRCWFVGDGVVNDVIGPVGAGVARGVLYDRFELYPHLSGVTRIARLGDLLGLIDEARPMGARVPLASGSTGHGHR